MAERIRGKTRAYLPHPRRGSASSFPPFTKRATRRPRSS